MVNKYIEDFIFSKTHVDGDISLNTQLAYTQDLILFFKYLLAFRKEKEYEEIKKDELQFIDINFIKNINRGEIASYFKYLINDRENDKSTKNRRISSLKEFYRYLNREYKVENVTEHMKKVKIRRLKKSIFLTEDEEQNFYSTFEPKRITYKRDIAIVTLMLKCGLRLFEVATLTRERLERYLVEDVINVIGKGDKEREIPITQSTKKILQDYTNSISEKSRIIYDKNGERLLFNISRRGIEKMVEQHAKSIEREDITPHKLRHTFGTRLSEKGVPMAVISELMGHESINTTSIYVHASDLSKINAIKKIS